MILRFQLLPCAVELAIEDPALAELVKYLANRADQPVQPIRKLRYDVTGAGPFEIHENGDFLDGVALPEDVLGVLNSRLHRRVYHLLSLGGWTLVHGAVVNVAGRRLLVTGDTGTGKSTLALHLLLRGHAVEGDELALIRGGDVVPFPRRIRVKPGTLARVPEFQPLAEGLPTTSEDGVPVAAFDPREGGYSWSLRTGPVDAVFLAVPNHDGRSDLRRIAPADALPHLLAQVIPIDDSPAARSRLVEAYGRLTRGVLFELRLGDLHEATRILETAPIDTGTPGAHGFQASRRAVAGAS